MYRKEVMKVDHDIFVITCDHCGMSFELNAVCYPDAEYMEEYPDAVISVTNQVKVDFCPYCGKKQ